VVLVVIQDQVKMVQILCLTQLVQVVAVAVVVLVVKQQVNLVDQAVVQGQTHQQMAVLEMLVRILQ
jgi:hypothetical protein